MHRYVHHNIGCSHVLLIYRNTDVNECANSTLNNCQHICENTEGGFSCNCLPGYSLLNSTHCQGKRVLVTTKMYHMYLRLRVVI